MSNVANVTGTTAAQASAGLRALLRTMERRCERAGWNITAGEWAGGVLTLELKRGPLCEPDRCIRLTGSAQRAVLERFRLGSRTERMGRRGDTYRAEVRTTEFMGRSTGKLADLLRDAAHYVTDNQSPLRLAATQRGAIKSTQEPT